ncbi:hypothetical protein GW951_01355 [Candidatus Wolfebacteria bacterium]|uniref:Uncharacterized protein n=1 Tax=Candidatus Wolfebacteria bacterium CG_4_10_14_0_2_um_filter_39_18 TaxID=1975061 RepID=A0A2M7TH23_9BACT|nr:hypothetical protein [Candidatus Wolfebacteria bacterium]PIZ45464.1 MAG: hypothetical protein COY31_00385 [Candidatus Wolfebacteria bacterium CG_4_10_14_0_2_um_filter_39_18]
MYLNTLWTKHSEAKMRFHGLSKQRVRRVLSSPKRIETGIAPNTVAMMQVAGSKKHPHEIWVMVQKKRQAASNKRQGITKIISAWRYPGTTKSGEPLPAEIISEMEESLL